MIPKASHSALVDLPEAILLFALIVLLIAEHILGERFLSEQLDQGLRGGLTTLVSMMVWRIGARVLPSPPTRPRRPSSRAKGNTIARDGGVLLAFALLFTACASSPEQVEARRAKVREAAASISQCAVAGGLGTCAPALSDLVGCAVRFGLSCEPERRAWSACLAMQAAGCGLAAAPILVAGAVDNRRPNDTQACAQYAAELCIGWADQPAGLEACFARQLEPCVD